jgi:O-antigen/teichoic acid export membrane protein
MNNLSSVREQVALIRELSTLDAGSPRVTALVLLVFGFSFTLTVLIAIPVTIGSWFVFDGPLDRPDLFGAALVAMGGYVFISNTSVNVETVLTAFRAAEDLFWVRLHQAAVFLFAAIAASFVWDSLWGLLVATLVAGATSTAHRLVAARRYMPMRVRRADLREAAGTLPPMIRFGLKLTPGTIADGVSHQVATWVLGALQAVSAVGAYSRAWLLGSRFLELKGRVTEMLFPTLVERGASGDAEASDRALVDSVRYSAIGMLFPGAVIGAVAPGVMALFGPGFGQGADALAVLMVVPAVVTVSGIQTVSMWAGDRPWATTVVSLLRMVIVVTLTIELTHAFGIVGAAIALLAGHLVGLVVNAVLVQPHLGGPVARFVSLRQGAAIPLAYGAGVVLGRVVYDHLAQVPGVLAGSLVAALAYVAVLLVAGGTNQRDRERLRQVRQAARQRLRRAQPVTA